MAKPLEGLRISRADVVRVARSWIGTPYHHQASVRGAGADCLGLVRGIYRTIYGRDPEHPPAYTRDWAEASGAETMLVSARRHLVEVEPSLAAPGDIVVFRFRAGCVAKHAAILSGPSSMIHAVERVGVAEVALSGWWRRQIAGAFSLPGLED